MPKIQPIEDVFSPERIEEIKASIRDALRERYGNHIDYCEIAIGYMVNGIALVYIGERQSQIEFIERTHNAQLAVNAKGEFVSFESKQGTEKFFGYETYIQEYDKTLLSFKLKRCYHVNRKEIISTDDYQKWNGITAQNQISISEFIICEIQVCKGKEYHDQYLECPNHFIKNNDDYSKQSFEEEIYWQEVDPEETDSDNDKIKTHYIITSCWGWNLNTLKHKTLDTGTFTRFIINNQYLLLCDKWSNHSYNEMREYETWDEEWEYEVKTSYYARSFNRLLTNHGINNSEILKERYGVFDIKKSKTTIHAGEVSNDNTLISGFIKLEFTKSNILTYDTLDSIAQKGVPYSSELPDAEDSQIYCSILGRFFLKARIWIADSDKMRNAHTGSNAGYWYIIREGKHAGRSLIWLIINGYTKDIVKMINRGYISFSGDMYHPRPIDNAIDNAIWTALDKQKVFENIQSINDHLVSKYGITKHFSHALISYEDEPTFEELVQKDVNYLIALINKRALYIEQSVIDELHTCHSGNRKYIAKLEKIEDALDGYKEDIKQYHQEIQYRIDAKYEEEERRYYENWGYRQAFEDDPEAEWNID